MTQARFRKKFFLACAIFFAGTALAFYTDTSLSEYTAFGAFLLGIFGASDVTDKKLNGAG